jgi:hypothetical protein
MHPNIPSSRSGSTSRSGELDTRDSRLIDSLQGLLNNARLLTSGCLDDAFGPVKKWHWLATN